MDLDIVVGKVIGRSEGSGWIQLHDFTPDAKKLEKRGRLFAVIKFLKNADDIETVNIGREILSRLNEEYFGTLEGDAFSALGESMRKVYSEFEGEGRKLEIAMGSFINGVFYVACVGETQAILYRNKSLVRILKSEDKVITASGYPKNGDIIALTSSNFSNVVSDGELKDVFDKNDVSQIEESLNSAVHKVNDSMGCLLIYFNKEVPTTSSQVKEATPQKPAVGNIKKRAVNIIDKLINILPEKKVVVRSEVTLGDKEKKIRPLLIGGAFLIILGVSVFFGIKRKNQANYVSSYSDKLNDAIHLLDEAKNLSSLSPERAREIFSQSKTEAKELTDAGIDDERLKKLNDDIKSYEGEILGVYMPDVNLFVDLTILRDGFHANLISGSADSIFVFDKDSKIGAQVDYQSKKTDLLDVSLGDKKPYKISTILGNFYVLADDGIYEVGDGGSKIIDKTWEGDADFYLYAANIYLVDKGNSKIIRFAGTTNGFAEGRDWLSSDTDINLGDEKDMVIDGSIWVLVGEGRIFKLVQGVPKTFSMDNVTPTLNQIDAIYTNENLEDLYVLDKGNNRLVAFDKEGKYVAQYEADKMSDFIDFVVSDKTNQAIFLDTSGKLYSLDLETK